MKKLFFLFLLTMFVIPQARAESGKGTEGAWRRIGHVMGRGFLNVLSFPLEIPRTAIQERENHRRLWPVTFLPRSFYHMALRATSAANDLLIFPWRLPFTEDISPITEPFDLPEYPWQKNV